MAVNSKCGHAPEGVLKGKSRDLGWRTRAGQGMFVTVSPQLTLAIVVLDPELIPIYTYHKNQFQPDS